MMITVIGSASIAGWSTAQTLASWPASEPRAHRAEYRDSTTSTMATPGMRESGRVRARPRRHALVNPQSDNVVLGQLVARKLAGDASARA